MATAVSKNVSVNPERKKLIAAAGLFVLLILVSYFTIFTDSESALPQTVESTDSNRVRNSDLVAGAQPKEEDLEQLKLTEPVEPLDLALATPPLLGEKVIRNPFDFKPDPPPIPPPPPVVIPPTILIGSVTPLSVIAGVPKGVNLTVRGNKIPIDAQIYWNNRPLKTEWISETEVRSSLSSTDIASPGMIQISLKSTSQPDKLWSGERQFQILPAPAPPFKYIGRIGDQAIIDYNNEKDGRKLVRAGDIVGITVQWKILAVSENQLELLDIRNDIKKSISIKRSP